MRYMVIWHGDMLIKHAGEHNTELAKHNMNTGQTNFDQVM